MVRCRVRNPGERLQQGPRQDPGCEHQDQEQDREQGLTQEAAEVFGRTQRSCQYRRRPGSRQRLPRIHRCRQSCQRHRRRCRCRYRRRCCRCYRGACPPRRPRPAPTGTHGRQDAARGGRPGGKSPPGSRNAFSSPKSAEESGGRGGAGGSSGLPGSPVEAESPAQGTRGPDTPPVPPARAPSCPGAHEQSPAE